MKKMKKPLVSVVMPVYNAEQFLAEAIESIVNQTYKRIEFIIVDDRSTDGSRDILLSYKRKYPRRIKLIRTKKNLNSGGDSCANVGIKHASGVYIARMDADDISEPTRIEKQVAFLEKHSDIVMVGSQAVVIDRDGKKIGVKHEPLTSEHIFRDYFTYHPIIHPSIMVRRIIGRKKFSYTLVYSANNDYLTFFTLLCRGYTFANLRSKLVRYRIHGKNDTFTNIKEKFMNTYYIRKTMVEKYGYKPTMKARTLHLVQFALLHVLPEILISRIYLLSKGIIKIRLSYPKFSLLTKSYASFARSVANFL